MKSIARQTWLVAEREFRHLLGTPMFWVLSGLFFLASTLVYAGLLVGFANSRFRDANDISANITLAVIRDLFYVVAYFMMIQVPLLTMRAVAEERRNGTLALLRTTPASEWSFVLGKFLANFAALGIYIVLTLAFPIATAFISDPEWPVVFSCYVALLLAAAAFVAIGIFFSSLTESQIIASVLTYVALFGMLVVSGMSEAVPSQSFNRLTHHLTFTAHLDGFLAGKLALHDAAYFLLLGALFLFFSVRQLESLRWRD